MKIIKDSKVILNSKHIKLEFRMGHVSMAILLQNEGYRNLIHAPFNACYLYVDIKKKTFNMDDNDLKFCIGTDYYQEVSLDDLKRIIKGKYIIQ